MISVNLSKDSDYHTQRNNRFVPMTSCNVTSAIMWLKANRIHFWSPTGMQEEDYLYSVLASPEAYQAMRGLAPWALRDGFPPNQVHAMLAWGINKIVGHDVCQFIENGSLQDLIWRLFCSTAVIMQGRFTRTGHIVCVVGFKSVQQDWEIDKPGDIVLDKVVDILVDDPYGNYHTGYSDHRGNNINFTLQEFDDLTEIPGREKWMHVLHRGER